MSDRVEIVEVGPRDGLQNEARIIETDRKVELIDLLSQAGFARIEVASFVSPKWVPQMADSDAVLGRITRSGGVRYAALTPNMKGFEAAMEARADEVAIFASASEGFSQANLNATRAEAMARFKPVMSAAKAAGIPVRGYVSCVVECPFDAAVDPHEVVSTASEMLEMGCYEISLGDTIGRASPTGVAAMLQAVCASVPPERLAGHFHDTSGRALANIDVALDHGLRVFDAAVGGLGGCPYAPGAAGNVATEAVARHLEARGFAHGLNLDIVDAASEVAKCMRP